MAERVGFDPLNAGPCTTLLGLGRMQQTQHLSEFRVRPDPIDVF